MVSGGGLEVNPSAPNKISNTPLGKEVTIVEFLGPESDESQPASRSSRLLLTTKLKLMKKNTKNVQMLVPDKSGICATCFFKFHDRTSKTGFYCIKTHEEVLPNGSC